MKSVYLHDVPLSTAQERFKKALQQAGLWKRLASEIIPLDENAINRVLAEPVWANISSPHYHASAMDGFTMQAELIAGAMPATPVTLQIGSQAAYVDTGDPIPDWANVVVPIEQVESLDDNGQIAADIRHPAAIRIRASLPPWNHIRPMGEDIVATQLVLPEGKIIQPADLGAIAASGHKQICVSRKPLVAIIPTGTELVAVGQKLKKGDIIEYNSIVLAAQVKKWGAEPFRLSPAPDDLHEIINRVQKAADEYDLLLVNAGSSAGSEDFTSQVVEHLGELLVHGVAVRPGHPVILGMVRRTENAKERAGKMVPVIGVPGYPVSAALTNEIFVEPLLSLWAGKAPEAPYEITAILTRKLASPAGDDDYVRVAIGKVRDRLLAAPLTRGAGVITSLVRADGILIVPSGIQGIEAGSPVQVRLYRSPKELENTILAIGSHDMTLDVLSQFLARYQRRLASSNVGSQGGLVALRRGEAHLAGSHLLDLQTGEYNISSIKQYLPDVPIRLVTWVGRQQGLLVAKGNPRIIKSLEDLARSDVTFVNRQRGAGTRILLDYHLEQLGIPPQSVRGYEQEEYTHLAVAAAVSSGRADCGLAVTAAASALELDFIPLYQERYDLVIPLQYLEDDFLAPIFELMRDSEFRKTISSMPGYDVSQMGTVVEIK